MRPRCSSSGCIRPPNARKASPPPSPYPERSEPMCQTIYPTAAGIKPAREYRCRHCGDYGAECQWIIERRFVLDDGSRTAWKAAGPACADEEFAVATCERLTT